MAFVITLAVAHILFAISAAQAFFQDNHKQLFISWGEAPFELSIIGKEKYNIKEKIVELENQLNRQVIEFKGNDSKIFVAFEGADVSLASALEATFQAKFGNEVVNRARSEGAFNLNVSPRFNCRTLYVYNPADVEYNPRYTDYNTPEFVLVWIGNKNSPSERDACIIEELAHAISLLPDRVVWFNSSVFNKNALSAPRIHLSWLDIQQMKFFLSDCPEKGMARKDIIICALKYPWVISHFI